MRILAMAAHNARLRFSNEDKLIAGTSELGYYGVIAAQDFIDGDTLAARLGITQGVSQFADGGWLKFARNGKILYVAKHTLRHSISWNAIDAASARIGSRTVQIAGKTYAVRLMKGIVGNMASGNDLYDPPAAYGSEWNQLMYRVNATAGLSKEGIPFGEWAAFTNDELSLTGNGAYNWCLEPNGADVLARGNGVVTGYFRGSSALTSTHRGWRPVLELVN